MGSGALRGCARLLRGMEGLDVLGASSAVARGGGPRRVQVTGYGASSFIVDDVAVKSAVLVFPRFALVWNVRMQADISRESLTAFELFNPKPQTLIVGIGAPGTAMSAEVYGVLRSIGIAFEVMDTPKALSTFNVLNTELRNVAAALLPAGCTS